MAKEQKKLPGLATNRGVNSEKRFYLDSWKSLKTQNVMVWKVCRNTWEPILSASNSHRKKKLIRPTFVILWPMKNVTYFFPLVTFCTVFKFQFGYDFWGSALFESETFCMEIIYVFFLSFSSKGYHRFLYWFAAGSLFSFFDQCSLKKKSHRRLGVNHLQAQVPWDSIVGFFLCVLSEILYYEMYTTENLCVLVWRPDNWVNTGSKWVKEMH